MTQKGKCFCGNISFEIKGDLIGLINCHCKDCQRIHGNYNPMMITSLDTIEFNQENPTWFKSSDKAERGFCNRCGSAMFKKLTEDNKILISAGCFDETSQFKTIRNIWEQSKGSYYVVPEVV